MEVLSQKRCDRVSKGKAVPSQSEINNFAGRLCKLLEDESTKLEGCSKQVRFDCWIKRLALSHFLEFGKTGCKRLRENSLEILPSVSTNERELRFVVGGDGCHVPRFTSQFMDAILSCVGRQRGSMQTPVV